MAAPRYADWQAALADAVRDARLLCRLVGIDPPEQPADSADFPVLVPKAFLARIRPGDPADPLLAQVIPQAAETAEVPGYSVDPLCEAAALLAPSLLAPSLLAKYRGRILMVASPRCGVHCRYCFRRHFPYRDWTCRPPDWEPAIARIEADSTVDEVILSGGDPLTLSDRPLAALLNRLDSIAHLRRIRLHTRLPVVIPQRVTDNLLGSIRALRLPLAVVIQVNHPAEIDDEVARAIGRLIEAGAMMLNQSVLLRGINDQVDTLAELSRRLIDLRVMPYYLHQLDRVSGTAHFEVAESVGVDLIARLRARLPGYAIPRYVRETPGGASKEVLA